tara:strand:- start:3947 stop:4741 length:795 start_codon:yes stop_codon:yes gene_type:complete
MNTSTMVTFHTIGGARIGFDFSADAVACIVARLEFARPLLTDDEPTLLYRSGRGRAGRRVFERHDSLRAESIEQIGTTIDDVVDDLHLSIALHATEGVFVHAGVVAWNEMAIILPGRSRAGKSTLVHELVRAGATYLSDEYARISSTGEIAPYPRPIQLRTSTGRRLVDPHTLGRVAERPYPPGVTVFTRHLAGAAFSPAPVPPAQAALELFDNTVVADVSPGAATRAVATVASATLAVRSDRDEASAVAEAILMLADRKVSAT